MSINADSQACFDQARRWLHDCRTKHDLCQSFANTEALLPTRVIDIGPVGEDIRPRLHISAQGEVGQWIALSHCWGKAQPLITTEETLEERVAAIPLVLLPPLFRDALYIVRELGYQYLWIDSLCIIQDSTQDWSKESATMDKVYGDSILCLAAEDCVNSATGIFESGNKLREEYRERIRVPCFNSNEPGKRGTMYTGPGWRSRRTSSGPLSERAWTLQEDVLSPRSLKWTSKQLEWGCRTMERVEQFPNEDYLDELSDMMIFKQTLQPKKELPLKALEPKMQNEIYTTWTRIVSRLSMRKITQKADRFPALSGIAKLVHERTGWTYKAGLWLERMHEGLLWHAELKGNYANFKLSETYIAPSWSWASAFYIDPPRMYSEPDGYRNSDQFPNRHTGIHFPEATRGWTTTTTIENVNIVTTGDAFARIQRASLKVSGLARRSGNELYIEILRKPYFSHLKHGETFEEGDITSPIGETSSGLILNPIAGQAGFYRRVGTFYSVDRQVFDHQLQESPKITPDKTQIEHWDASWATQTVIIL